MPYLALVETKRITVHICYVEFVNIYLLELTLFPHQQVTPRYEHCAELQLSAVKISGVAQILGAILFVKYSMVPVCYLQEKKLNVFAEESWTQVLAESSAFVKCIL
jgi:hypothetical protein